MIKSNLVLSGCFDADDKGLPTDIKVEVATFFQKMNKAEGCFHNYSKVFC